jgi:hypothetical protein
MSKAKNSTDVLKAALWMLENVGWTKHQSYELDDMGMGKYVGFCSLGAIDKVEADPLFKDEAVDRLRKTVGHYYVCDFNDNDHTTKQMVVAAFKKAIKNKK